MEVIETILECSYSVSDLQPILDLLTVNNESSRFLIEELVKVKVFLLWIVGLNIAIFSVLIIIIFSIFFANVKN